MFEGLVAERSLKDWSLRKIGWKYRCQSRARERGEFLFFMFAIYLRFFDRVCTHTLG